MSAVIQNEYTGNNSTTTYSFTFPYLKTSDIKASLDGVVTTAFTLPSATTLQFNTAPASGVIIKIFRETSVDNLTATFYAGSAIKSEDLNDNFTQNLYKTQEVGARSLSTLGGTMSGDLNIGYQADINFEGTTEDGNDTTLTVVDPTANQTYRLPNNSAGTYNLVSTGDTGTVATAMIAADAVNGTKIADDSIDSEHYVDGSIDTQHIADAQITTAKIADDAVTAAKIDTNAVFTGSIQDGAVTTVKLSNDAVTTVKITDANITTAKIANDAVSGVKIQDGAITQAKLSNNSVSNAKMLDDSVGSSELIDGSVLTAHIGDNQVTLAKMADNSVGTSELVDGSVTTPKLASNAVTTAKITDANVTTAKLANDAVTNDKLANNSVSTENIQDGDVSTAKIADSGVTTAKIADDAVTTAKIANDAITSAKIADDAVGSSELGDGVIDTVHIGSVQVTDAKLASNAVTTAKITDANVTTAKIANDAITIGKIGCEQTTISDSDSHIPTSGAVVDYVAAQLAPLGGFEAIANEQSFPNTQPASGVVISIADAGGLAVSNSGTASGQTVGGTTVNITGIASNFNGTTISNGVRFLVASTGSGQNYTYHKATLKEDDLINLSGDINDFSERYRVGSTNPTSSLDNGDLFFNTSTGKLLVYNGTNSAWEEAQSIGNFFISTLSPAFNGSAIDFTLSNAPTNVQQVILSINGVIQKPNAGTSRPSEGFSLNGSTIQLPTGSAPATGSDYFAIVMGSTVNIGTPSNNTVTTAILQNDSVTAAKIAAGAVGSTELAAGAVTTSKIANTAVGAGNIQPNAVETAKIQDEAVTLAKLEHGTSSNDGKFLRANNGADPSFETVDLTTKFSKAGGDTITGDFTIASGTTNKNINVDVSDKIRFDDNLKATFGNSDDLQIYHDGNNKIIGGNGYVRVAASNSSLYLDGNNTHIRSGDGGETQAKFITNGAAELYHSGNKKLETTSSGVALTGNLELAGAGQNVSTNWDNSAWEKLTFDNSYNQNAQGPNKIVLQDDNNWKAGFGIAANEVSMYTGGNIVLYSKSTDSTASQKEVLAKFNGDGNVELYHDNSKKFETTSGGATVTGTCTATAFAGDGSALTGITSFVSGMIMMYNSATPPSGWYLCNGQNGTPDLRDRFIVGAGNSYSQGATGGSNTATDTVNISGSDTVSISVSVSGSGTTGYDSSAGNGSNYNHAGLGSMKRHNHSFSFSGSGSGSDTVNISGSDTVSIDTRSPYYALTFIMKA